MGFRDPHVHVVQSGEVWVVKLFVLDEDPDEPGGVLRESESRTLEGARLVLRELLQEFAREGVSWEIVT